MAIPGPVYALHGACFRDSIPVLFDFCDRRKVWTKKGQLHVADDILNCKATEADGTLWSTDPTPPYDIHDQG